MDLKRIRRRAELRRKSELTTEEAKELEAIELYKSREKRRNELSRKKFDELIHPSEEAELAALWAVMEAEDNSVPDEELKESLKAARQMVAPPQFKRPSITLSKSGSVVTIQCQTSEDADEVFEFLEGCVTDE